MPVQFLLFFFNVLETNSKVLHPHIEAPPQCSKVPYSHQGDTPLLLISIDAMGKYKHYESNYAQENYLILLNIHEKNRTSQHSTEGLP